MMHKPASTAMTPFLFSLVLLMLASVASVFSLSAAPAFAGTSTLQPGYYVGPGDGATVIFHVLPNGQATLGALNIYGGAGWHPSPITAANIKAAGNTHTPGVFTGSLKKAGATGSYLFQLGTPVKKFSYCEYVITVKPVGLSFQQRHGFTSGCMYYHGASWSFDASMPHRRLKRDFSVH